MCVCVCVCVCGGVVVVINHLITHLSEFRQAGERGEGGSAGWEEGGEKAKEGMRYEEELNDKRRNAKEAGAAGLEKQRGESCIVVV